MSAGVTGIQTVAFRRFAHYLPVFPKRRPQNTPQIPNSDPRALPGRLVCCLCGIDGGRERVVESFLAKGTNYVYVGVISFFFSQNSFKDLPSVLSQNSSAWNRQGAVICQANVATKRRNDECAASLSNKRMNKSFVTTSKKW